MPARPVTATYLRRASLHYLSQRATSRATLEQVLRRRARRRLGVRRLDDAIEHLIGVTLDALVAEKLLDDAAYARLRKAALQRKGLPERRITAGLAQKGIEPETIAAAMTEESVDDLAQARRFAERRRLGSWSTKPETPDRHRKDLAALARAGFSYAIAARALKPMDD